MAKTKKDKPEGPTYTPRKAIEIPGKSDDMEELRPHLCQAFHRGRVCGASGHYGGG